MAKPEIDLDISDSLSGGDWTQADEWDGTAWIPSTYNFRFSQDQGGTTVYNGDVEFNNTSPGVEQFNVVSNTYPITNISFDAVTDSFESHSLGSNGLKWRVKEKNMLWNIPVDYTVYAEISATVIVRCHPVMRNSRSGGVFFSPVTGLMVNLPEEAI